MTAPTRGPRGRVDPISTVVFDLGGVLIDWDPRYLFRELLDSDEEVETFLLEVGFEAWNHEVDAGRTTWAEATEALAAAFPHRRALVEAYPARFAETMPVAVEGSVELLDELHREGVRLLALTNWSAETFPLAQERFDFLRVFEAIIVSGHERLAKPDPEIFALLLRRHSLDPSSTLFVDDRAVNVEAAERAGLVGLQFLDAPTLRADLESLGLLRAQR